MTRINSNLAPHLLNKQMLFAEYREIKRIPNTIKSGKAKVDLTKIPREFKLSTGHVVFFYNKLKFLHKRYLLLKDECLLRGINITSYDESFEDLPKDLYNDWEATAESLELIKERIKERLTKK